MHTRDLKSALVQIYKQNATASLHAVCVHTFTVYSINWTTCERLLTDTYIFYFWHIKLNLGEKTLYFLHYGYFKLFYLRYISHHFTTAFYCRQKTDPLPVMFVFSKVLLLLVTNRCFLGWKLGLGDSQRGWLYSASWNILQHLQSPRICKMLYLIFSKTKSYCLQSKYVTLIISIYFKRKLLFLFNIERVSYRYAHNVHKIYLKSNTFLR